MENFDIPLAVGVAMALLICASPAALAGQQQERDSETLATHFGRLDAAVSVPRDMAAGTADVLPRSVREEAKRAEQAAMQGTAPRAERRAAALDVRRESKAAIRQADRTAQALDADVRATGRVAKAAGRIGTAANAAHKVDQALNGEFEDLAYDGAQDLTDAAVQKGLRVAGTAICGPGCGTVAESAHTAGTVLREIDLCAMGMADCGPGRKRTVWDVTTDAQYTVYEKVRFALDPESDPMSDEFERKWRAKAEANRRAYQQQSAVLEAAQAQVDAARAAAAQAQAAAAQTAYAGSEPGLFDTLGDVMNTALQMQVMQNALASQPSSASPAAADPSGCHPGHDEQAHPGGCHDYSGGTATNR